jgi:hypothetical protein
MTERSLKLLFFVGIAVICGVGGFLGARGLPEPAWWYWTSSVLVIANVFAWYRQDAINRSFARKPWMNVGVAALSLVFIPIYILQRSEPGARLRAAGGMLGYLMIFLLVAVVAGLVGEAIG